MVASKAWRLYVAHWPELLTAYVFAILLYGLVALVAALITAPLLTGGALVGKLFLAAVLVGIIWLAVAPLAKGGLYDAVIRAQRGRAPGAGEFWQAGLRYWGRCLALCVFQLPLGLLLYLAWSLLARLSPVLGAGFALLLAAPVLVVMVGFVQYVAIAEDCGAGAAISRAVRIVVRRPGDVVMTTAVLAGGTLVLGVVGFFLGEVPVAGPALQLFVLLAWAPYGLLYLAVRYESRVAPALSPLGGVAVFHVNPPPGAGV
ncbi:MAG: hypothetical protein JWN15_2984 [Firmicutes bacterium]|nr:hypothetical protein [Bacillota bacterium]